MSDHGAAHGQLSAKAWLVRGAVQGVGFRPWVFAKARELGLSGSVKNSPGGVEVEAAGTGAALASLEAALRSGAPRPARVDAVEESPLSEKAAIELLEAHHCRGAAFSIAPSRSEAAPEFNALALPQVSPDIAMCPDCLAEILDPRSRRYRYPFTTCARCGPRYTIYETAPFDRERTTMRAFPLCRACEEEYRNPADRRFHAQAMACPACGPQLRWLDNRGALLETGGGALGAAAAALRQGRIVAALGVGGFHLMVRADLPDAVALLRERKRRPWKPFALMCRDIGEIGGAVKVGARELALLRSPEAPIVLLERDGAEDAFAGVADGAPCLGVMLAATPMHWLLLEAVGAPVVATSGNLSESPVCFREPEALGRLAGVADFFLSHDRPVARRCDDSVARVIAGRTTLLRRARGFVPNPVFFPIFGREHPSPDIVLGAGGHQKNAPAILAGGTLLQAAHVGDLASPGARDAWRQDVGWLLDMVGNKTRVRVATDLHPDYASTIEAERMAFPRAAVQHHAAHAFAALAESGLREALAVVWDGTGLGADGTVWGGEFFLVNLAVGWRRVAWLMPFPLPGGEAAALEPWRSAAGALAALAGRRHPLFGKVADKLEEPGRIFLRQAAAGRGSTGAVLTSSAGRLFDAAASLLGLVRGKASDSQAPILLENAARRFASVSCKPAPKAPAPTLVESAAGIVVDWGDAFLDCAAEDCPDRGAHLWHGALAEGIRSVAGRVGHPAVLLAGGCFQNKILAETAIRALEAAGHSVFLPEKIPCNDGGLAAGQCVLGTAQLGPESTRQKTAAEESP